MSESVSTLNKHEYKNGLVLGCSTGIALLVIVIAFQLTRAPIEKTAQAQLQNNLTQLLAPNSYDNNPATDTILLSNPALGTDIPQPVYRARTQGTPTGAVITAIAPNAYNGSIELLVGLSYNGDVVAVRVTKHQETPGLGDDIDISRSSWISSFDGLSPSKMNPNDWQVKKDGGKFDQFTGATITPRAVIQSVHRVAQWYQKNQDKVFMNTLEN